MLTVFNYNAVFSKTERLCFIFHHGMAIKQGYIVYTCGFKITTCQRWPACHPRWSAWSQWSGWASPPRTSNCWRRCRTCARKFCSFTLQHISMRGSGFGFWAPLNFLGDEALVEVVSGDPSRYEDAVADLQARLVHPRQGPHLTLEAASGLGNQTRFILAAMSWGKSTLFILYIMILIIVMVTWARS